MCKVTLQATAHGDCHLFDVTSDFSLAITALAHGQHTLEDTLGSINRHKVRVGEAIECGIDNLRAFATSFPRSKCVGSLKQY